MVSTKHLLDHIEALLRLSRDVKDRAISAQIREMADELRILISVADVTDLATVLGGASVAVPVSNEIISALYGTKPKRRRRAKENASDASSPKPKRRTKKARRQMDSFEEET
jgi:hypothetical protein